ncbi:MAG: L-ribulose-5-phosphate 4-epimerase [Sporolactobacillus sp.]|jgi:L-ribulose-5-phosphate 4-epimerase|nr:L-ribulose-5-phosphate 4-epimerase [Sporolactobacillus sp.]
MLEELKKQVYEANMLLPKYDLVTFTWGNVSGIDRVKKLFVIKPSGVPYEELSPEKMVVVDLDGNVIEGDLNPSSDTPTHRVLYRAFPNIKGIVHTHSPWAVSFAQAGIDIPAAGTTHADTFYGPVPVSDPMKKEEVVTDYEKQTGDVIVRTFAERHINPDQVPAVLVNDHGPFTWGKSAVEAVHNAVVLEEVAKMTYHSLQLNPHNIEMDQYLLDKHFLRKHGKNAYYGQKKN